MLAVADFGDEKKSDTLETLSLTDSIILLRNLPKVSRIFFTPSNNLPKKLVGSALSASTIIKELFYLIR